MPRYMSVCAYGRVIGILLSFCFLSACAVMTEKECLNADWATYGFLDGSQGYQKTFINTRTQACQEHGVTVGVDAYLQGWQRGVRQYCTPDNAFSQGKQGADYQGICPLDMEKAFAHYYQEGLIVHAAHQRVADIEQDIDSSREMLEELEQDIAKTRSQLEDLGLKRADRQRLLDKLDALYQTKAMRSSQLYELYRQQDEAKVALRFVQTQHPRPY